jgi:hypothetical protein
MRRWGTTLHAVLHREGGRPLGALQREAVAFQLASGLVALHAANVVHCDVKSGNALLNINPDECGGVQACWSDFGLAHVGAISTVRTQRAMGSLGYMAPEIAEPPEGSGIPYRAAADVYAFGVVLAELVSGKAPAWGGGTGFFFLAQWVRTQDYRVTDCAVHDVFGSHPLVAELLLGVVKSTTAQDFAARPVMLTVKDALERDARAPLAAAAAPPAQAAPPAAQAAGEAHIRECRVCLDRHPTPVLRPCIHAVMCSECVHDVRWNRICPRCFYCGVQGHRVRECPHNPTEKEIRTARLKELKADKTANRTGRLSAGQHRRMEQDMAHSSTDSCHTSVTSDLQPSRAPHVFALSSRTCDPRGRGCDSVLLEDR